MKFTKVIGKIDPKLVEQAEQKLSKVFIELGTRYTNEFIGTGMGGDPLIFALMYPVEHVCTLNIPTAATDGKRFYWNPKFIIKLGAKSLIGLRIVCGHEAWHALYMHPQRRGSRIPKLWNIAVDYIVNGTIMDDLKARKLNPGATFAEHLGRYMTLSQYASFLKDPEAKIPGFEDINIAEDGVDSNIKLPRPDEDRELTPQEKECLDKKSKGVKFFYADPDLEDDMKRPERIYDLLYSLLPKCPKCGKVGMYKLKKNKNKKDKGNSQNNKSNQNNQNPGNDQKDKAGQNPGENANKHSHGGNEPCNCPDHQNGSNQSDSSDGEGCCDGGVDIFGLGGTVDDHMDTEESEEKLAKRISDAKESAQRMAGYIPAALEDELGKLTAPKVTWQDIIRTRLLKARNGNGRNDWTRFRTRPMFSGLLVPKRRNYYAHFGCLLDTSGSMTKDDMAFGLSQLCSLDERSEGTVVPADAEIYWDKATKLKKLSPDEVSKIKIVGRGGTKFADFFANYEKNIGKCDFLIVVTDGFLLDTDIAEMQNPGIDVIWLITGASNFKPPFGRAFDLHSS